MKRMRVHAVAAPDGRGGGTGRSGMHAWRDWLSEDDRYRQRPFLGLVQELTSSNMPVGRPSMLVEFFSRRYCSRAASPLASAQRVSWSRSPMD